MKRRLGCFARRGIALVLFNAAAMFLFGLQIAAQPGDEARWYERTAASVKALDAKIAQLPNDADLYFQRGSLYLSFFHRHPDIAEFRGVVYANDPGVKALADLDRAIQLAPAKSDYYVGRGKFYEFQWSHALSREAEAVASSWEKIRLLFWDNRSFESSLKDYQKALSIARNNSETSHPLGRLAWMYRTRAMSVSFYAPAKTVRAEKQTRLVFEDFDRSLEFTRKYLDVSQPQADWTFMIRDIYFDKARAAVEFEEYAVGIQFLTNAIEEIEGRQASTEGLCSLYVLRGDVHQKLKDNNAAIRDYTFPIANKYVNCNEIYEKRGDAFAAIGEWRRAIQDYSHELAKFSYPHVSLLTRRAKAYIKSGEAEKAIADLNEAMTYHKSCSEQYRLRAEAHRLLKDEDRVADDNKAAAKFSRNKVGCGL